MNVSHTPIRRLLAENQPLLTVDLEETILQVARKMRKRRVGCAIVLDDQLRILGIVTERDIAHKCVADLRDVTATTVGEIMTRDVIACSPEEPIEQARTVMAENGIRHLPVVDKNRLVGIVSSRDVLSHQLDAARALARKQSHMLQGLEKNYPGISQVRTDGAGRIVI